MALHDMAIQAPRTKDATSLKGRIKSGYGGIVLLSVGSNPP